jgi:hypothetical protein
MWFLIMDDVCFNCQKTIDSSKPICPYCFVVRGNKFSRDEVFDYLDHYLPTKISKQKKKFTSVNKPVHTFHYWRWFFVGLISFGVGYQYYLLLTYKALNDHWFYPHYGSENTTEIDMLTSTLIIFFGFLLGLPLVQYIRYEKLYRHCLTAPEDSIPKDFKIKGISIFGFYILFYFLLAISIALLVIGIGAAVSGMYFNFNSTAVMAIFFTGSGFILFSSFIVLIQILIYEKLWQDVFNYHVNWHRQTDAYDRL